MNNKIFLVAHREYMENLRTKTFWIGIFFFPILITASIVVPMLLEKTKGPRTYAVVDRSGWLLEAVDERAAMPDLVKVFTLALDRYRDQDADFADLPPALQRSGEQLGVALDMIDDHVEALPQEEQGDEIKRLEEEVIEGFARLMSGLEGAEGEQLRSAGLLPDEAVDGLLALREEIRLWWKELPSEEAEALGGTDTKNRYVRIPAPGNDEAAIAELNRLISDDEIFAYFVIGKDPVSGSEGCRYVSNNLTDDDLKSWFASVANSVVRERRLTQRDIDAETANWIQAPLRFAPRKVSRGGAEQVVGTQDMLRQWAPVVFVYMLWIAVFSISQSLLTNTVEEKSNRIMEVLLSSVSPIELMAGKIAGIAATGLTVIITWMICFILAVEFVPGLLGGELGIDLTVIASDPLYLGSFVIYFLLGYLLYASLLVGIGSVCNSLKEAQNLMMPVTVMLMLPLLAMVPISKDPNGILAKTLSFIPPFTPFAMMNRAAGPPSPSEYVITTILLLAAIGFALWAAAKVFRIGVLMTGKAPTFPEIVRWIRAPVGQVPHRGPGSTDS
jgi:ABC-2 type transport system permease protein